jgi:hypothetical protein
MKMTKISEKYLETIPFNIEEYTRIVQLEAKRDYNNWLYFIMHEEDDFINKVLANDIVNINKEIEDFKIKNKI